MKNVYTFDILFDVDRRGLIGQLPIEMIEKWAIEEDEEPKNLSEVFEKNNGISEKDFMTMHQNDNQSSSN